MLISKNDLRISLVEILELAKVHRDLSVDGEHERWVTVARLAHKALGEPSVADLEEFKRQARKAGAM